MPAVGPPQALRSRLGFELRTVHESQNTSSAVMAKAITPLSLRALSIASSD